MSPEDINMVLLTIFIYLAVMIGFKRYLRMRERRRILKKRWIKELLPPSDIRKELEKKTARED